jgi:hypothetical protein
MSGKFHGVFSLLLIAAAVVIALAYMLSNSLGWGLVYLVIIVFAAPIVLYSYCAKCLCREDACSHFFPGKLTRLLPNRKSAPYSFIDYFGTAVSLSIVFGLPQFWLWQNRSFFLLFWVLLAGGLVEILFFVCRACSNTSCPNCYKKIQTII